MSWVLRRRDRRNGVIDMIPVARLAILARHAAGVAGLAEILFYRIEFRCKGVRIALLVTLQIGTHSFPGVRASRGT